VTKRARGHEFPEPDEHPESDIDWDEVVDIICVGTEPGPQENHRRVCRPPHRQTTG